MSPKAVPGGLEYGLTVNGKMYYSLYKHRGSGDRTKKSIWKDTISPDIEYSIFSSADEHDWYDENIDYWGLLDQGKTKLGTKGERICKFPCTSNAPDPWHGYPVSSVSEKDKDLPSDSLVEKWIDHNFVTKEFGRKIQRMRIS